MTLSLFLEKHQTEANKQLDNYNYNSMNALENMANAEFGKAAAYYQNVVRGLEALQIMKDAKLQADQVAFILGQIKGRQDQEELLGKLGFR